MSKNFLRGWGEYMFPEVMVEETTNRFDVKRGLFFNNLVETIYLCRGYRKIEDK